MLHPLHLGFNQKSLEMQKKNQKSITYKHKKNRNRTYSEMTEMLETVDKRKGKRKMLYNTKQIFINVCINEN